MKNVIIETKDLCKDYDTNGVTQNILKNINLEIYEGDFTVIMGSSGSGKSTLLYLLSYMNKPTNGEIKFLGENINYSDKELAKIHSSEMSFVFQSSNLLPELTGFENISYPAYLTNSKENVNKATESILRRFNIESIKDKYPSEMSGGQQQRVAIARAIVNNPKVIFADEPTGALNSNSSVEVLDLLTEVNSEGETVIMVTHDIKACARGNRLLFIRDGQISAELELGKYSPRNQNEREEKIFQFLKRNNW